MLQADDDESTQRFKRMAAVKSVEESLVKIETAVDTAPAKGQPPKAARAP
jgi:hypothetical protein